jgi:hypothetical protein
VPTEITVLTVQPPNLLGANVSELGHRHLVPFVGPLKTGALFKQDRLVPFEAEAYAKFVAHAWTHPHLAESSESLVDLSALQLRESHASESSARLSV